nr:hypothetical protein [Tanacetum cinerariifolium]
MGRGILWKLLILNMSDDGFVELNRKNGKGKQNGKPRHIDGVRLTQPQPNYFYRVVSNWVNVNDEASTSQPKENKEASSQPKSNVNGKASTSQPKENKEAASQSNAFSALEEDNGNPMDDLIYETRMKVEVPPKKPPKKTGIWSGRKADSSKRNIVFSHKTKVYYFDRDDMEFNDMGRWPRDGSMRMSTAIIVDGFLMVISISCEPTYFAS